MKLVFIQFRNSLQYTLIVICNKFESIIKMTYWYVLHPNNSEK